MPSLPPFNRAISRYQYTPRKAGTQEQFDFLCLLSEFLAFPSANEPIQRNRRFYPRRICNGGELCRVRQRVPRWVLPRLPRRAGYPRDSCRLRLAQVAELAHVLQPSLDGLPILSRRTAAEKRSFCVQCNTPPLFFSLSLFRRNARPRVFGFFATFPRSFGRYIHHTTVSLTCPQVVRKLQMRVPTCAG